MKDGQLAAEQLSEALHRDAEMLEYCQARLADVQTKRRSLEQDMLQTFAVQRGSRLNLENGQD